jgi:hypothetical protein
MGPYHRAVHDEMF